MWAEDGVWSVCELILRCFCTILHSLCSFPFKQFLSFCLVFWESIFTEMYEDILLSYLSLYAALLLEHLRQLLFSLLYCFMFYSQIRVLTKIWRTCLLSYIIKYAHIIKHTFKWCIIIHVWRRSLSFRLFSWSGTIWLVPREAGTFGAFSVWHRK